jgi:hypothetical protein
MNNRRNFIKKLTAAGILSSVPNVFFPWENDLYSQQKPKSPEAKIWALLLHLSFNMWEKKTPYLELSESLWNDALAKLVKAGGNMVVIDLGDAVKYESHPEIVINNAWSRERLHDELQKIRKMGLEPIPKLNFSAGHDAWLGEYSHMLSTKIYYNVCSDIIGEVIELFDTPRLFHIGMDEEDLSNQRDYEMTIIRQNELYWGDLYFLFSEVQKRGVRPWIWQDFVRSYPLDKFAKLMPKLPVMSNWYNGTDFSKPQTNSSLKAYVDLDAMGYDQIPGGSNYYEGSERCLMSNVQFCTEKVADSRLLGFIQSPWKQTIEVNREHILKGIELLGEAKAWYDKNHK